MKICPLTNQECAEEKCGWYSELWKMCGVPAVAAKQQADELEQKTLRLMAETKQIQKYAAKIPGKPFYMADPAEMSDCWKKRMEEMKNEEHGAFEDLGDRSE